jgi:hypothetical protein
MIYLIFNIFIYSGGRKGPPLLEVGGGCVVGQTAGWWCQTEGVVVSHFERGRVCGGSNGGGGVKQR